MASGDGCQQEPGGSRQMPERLTIDLQVLDWNTFPYKKRQIDGETLQLRQPVFRCLATNITQPGWHNWQTNYAASPNNAGLAVDWHGALCAETRVP